MIFNKIDNITPFNKLFFKNCFYNSFFAVIMHYNKSIMPFLMNSTPVYDITKENNIVISLDFILKENEEDLLHKVGILENIKSPNEEFVAGIIDSIDNKTPVVSWVDCFYIPIRPEFYLSTHWKHALIVYGYDNEKRVFNIIEQKHHDSLTYRETVIEYEHLVQANLGCEALTGQSCPSINYKLEQESYTISDERSNDFITLIENMNIHREKIYEGLEKLKMFIMNSSKIFLDESLLKENVNKVIEGLNQIINGKKVQNYILNNITNKDLNILIKKTSKVESDWNLIRYKILKYSFSGIYVPEDFRELQNKLIEIYNSELDYYQTLYNYKGSIL